MQNQNIIDNIRLASFNDRVKDFIDIAFLSSEISLNQMLNAYKQKYSSNPVMPLKALMFYDDLNFDEPIKMAKNNLFKWKTVKKRIELMQKYPDKLFEKVK